MIGEVTFLNQLYTDIILYIGSNGSSIFIQ